jgi:dTDP-4-dehydrorhamnose reductase
MQTVLITGANGFVGHYLTEVLLSKNYKVIATGRGESRLSFSHQNFQYEPLDFTSEQQVKSVLQKHKPDVVVHGGAISKPDICETNKEEAYRINVTGTINLLQWAAELKSFFVYISTDFVFSGEKGIYHEEDETGPVNYYGQTKLLAEAEVLNYPFGWSIVRTVLVYGHPKSGRHNILTTVAETLKKGEMLNIFSDQMRTPTYVEDLAAGIASIIEKRAGGVFHLSGEDMLTPYQMACAVAGYLQLNQNLIKEVTEATFQQPAKRPPKTCFDLNKAKQQLNYKTTSFEEGLKKTFES